MFVSIMAFFARVSDPAVGGTYMTLLNTLTNLGGNWPSTLALWLVDPLTSKQCSAAAATDNSCASPELAAACVEAGGSCATTLDGYYVECGVCFVLGLGWLLAWGRRTINSLTEAPEAEWRVVHSPDTKRK